MGSASFRELMAPFAALELPAELDEIDWIEQPRRFNERLSASLWSTHQIDAYRDAAHRYEKRLADALQGKPPVLPRLVMVIVGNGVPQTNRVLFRKLRPQGVIFNAVQPAGAFDALVECISGRAKTHPEPYAHWYIDGGTPRPDCGTAQGITSISYEQLAPFAFKELNLVNDFAGNSRPQAPIGPEEVQSFMASLGPADLAWQRKPEMRRFGSSRPASSPKEPARRSSAPHLFNGVHEKACAARNQSRCSPDLARDRLRPP